MTDTATSRTDIQQIVERLLRLQEENRRKIRPGEAKSAPSTPTTEQRIASRSLSRHDTFIASRRNYPEHPPTHLATPTHNLYLHPLPAHCPTPQSYQPMEIKGTNFKNNRNGLKYLSRSTPSMSPSGSPHHSDSEGPTRISRKTKKFLRQFRNVPSAERVIKYYACAIVSDILLQGTLYITENYFAFYSNIFGYVNRTLIPIVNVCKIQKEKTAKFIPNAVGIQTFDGQTFVFSSLISRHATYKFMIHMWRKSRNLTDNDIEATMPGVTEEICLDESGSNSADSTMEDCLGLPVTNHHKPSLAHQNATAWSKSSPLIVPADFPVETTISYTENNASNATPETCISTASYNEVRNTIEVVGTSAIETEAVITQPKENFCHKVHRSNSKGGSNTERNVRWIIKTEVVKSAVNIGIAPFRAVKESLQEFTVMPKSSLLKFMSSSLIVCLLVSAAFMVYRVESLNGRLKSNTFQYGDLYEEVLEMQQKLHAATAQEIEKTLNHQLRQLVTVKQSLEALIFLLNPDHNSAKSHIQETTY